MTIIPLSQIAPEIEPREQAKRSFLRIMEPLLKLGEAHPDATEIFIDGDEIRLSWGDRRQLFSFASPEIRPLTRHAVMAAGSLAAVFDNIEFGPTPPARPYFSVKVPPDLRVTYSIPPVSDHAHVAIRFLRSRKLTLDDYVAAGIMTGAQCGLIRKLLMDHKNVIVSGGTGSGKTTLLRAMIAEIADAERLVILQDTAELAVDGTNVVHLHAGQFASLSDLLVHTLRTTPDRIIVGEVRGKEALELCRAMNTGHDGTLTTLHSNGAQQALLRLHTLALEGQPTFPPAGVMSAVDAVIQLTGKERRYVSDIWLVPDEDKNIEQKMLARVHHQNG